MENKEQEISLSYALIHARCARCRKGRMFEPGFFKQKMFIRCEACDLFYERHPGYFYVSMYVSYAMNVIEIITLGIATFFISGGSENVLIYLFVILASVFILSPFNYRYSRVLHMHFLDPGLRYQPEILKYVSETKLKTEAKNTSI